MKTLTHIVALLLVPCLIADPALASLASKQTFLRQSAPISCSELFAQEALVGYIVNAWTAFSPKAKKNEVQMYKQLNGQVSADSYGYVSLNLLQKRLFRHFDSRGIQTVADEIVRTVERGMPEASLEDVHAMVDARLRNTWPKTVWKLYLQGYRSRPIQIVSFLNAALASVQIVMGGNILTALMVLLLPHFGFLVVAVTVFLQGSGAANQGVIVLGNFSEWELRQIVSHEVAHVLFPGQNHVQNTFARLRLYEAGRSAQPAEEVVKIIERVPISEIQDHLKELAKDSARAELSWRRWLFNPSEPAWSYTYGDYLADALWILTKGDVRHSFAAATLIGRDVPLPEAVSKGSLIVPIWNARPLLTSPGIAIPVIAISEAPRKEPVTSDPEIVPSPTKVHHPPNTWSPVPLRPSLFSVRPFHIQEAAAVRNQIGRRLKSLNLLSPSTFLILLAPLVGTIILFSAVGHGTFTGSSKDVPSSMAMLVLPYLTLRSEKLKSWHANLFAKAA